LACATIVGGTSLQAQERSVTLTTSKAVGTEITLLVNHTYNGVTVDWGDGNPQTYNTGKDAIREITGTVKGSTITITGDAMWNTLSCEGCGVTGIDLTNAKKLESLYLADNELTTIDLKGMTSLRDLDVSNNALTSITFTNSSKPETDLSSIETLNYANNQLSGQFVVRTSTLQSIDVSNNNYTTILVSSNKNLDALKCSGNNVTTLNTSVCSSISSLVCNDNDIKTLTLPGSISTLRQLVCDDNNISSKLDLSASEDLVDLSCANNSISTLTLPTVNKLSSLNLSNNALTFSLLPKKALRPNYISFMPQAQVDISGYDNVLTKDGVSYAAIGDWSSKSTNPIDLGALRYIAVTETSTGTMEGVITWYSETVDADGNATATALTAGKSSSAPNDYYLSSGKTVFFTPQGRVFARITASSVYKDCDFYLETSRIAVGEDQISAIGTIVSASGELSVLAQHGQLLLSSATATHVNVYSADGKQVWNGTVNGTTTLQLPAGIYIVNGQKVAL
jgi:hypothetical protein